jgi:hypothetical protein
MVGMRWTRGLVALTLLALATGTAAAGAAPPRQALRFSSVALPDSDRASQRFSARLVSDGRSRVLASLQHGYPGGLPAPGDAVPSFTSWSSSDSGRTWAPPAQVAPAPCAAASVDGYTGPSLVGARGWWLQNCNGVNTVYLSDDGGRSWAPAGQPVTGAAVDEGFVTGDPRNPQRVWTVTHAPAAFPRVLIVTRSDDGGRTTTTWPVNADETPDEVAQDAINFFTPVLVDPRDSDHLRVFWIAGTAASRACTASEQTEVLGAWHYFTTTFTADSHDGGRTWRTQQIGALPDAPCPAPDTPPAELHTSRYDIADLFPSAALDAAGNPYLVYAQVSPGAAGRQQTHVMLTRSADGGRTWRTTRVDTDGGAAFAPVVVAGDRGRVDVAWLAASTVDQLDRTAAWRVVLAQTQDAIASAPRFVQTPVSDVVHTGALCPVSCSGTAADGTTRVAEHQTLGLALDQRGRALLLWLTDARGAHSATGDEVPVIARQIAGPALRS